MVNEILVPHPEGYSVLEMEGRRKNEKREGDRTRETRRGGKKEGGKRGREKEKHKKETVRNRWKGKVRKKQKGQC